MSEPTDSGQDLAGPTSTPFSARARSSALGILSLLLVFFFLEATARIVFTVRDDVVGYGAVEEEYWVHSRELMWELRPNFEGDDETGQPRSYDSEGFLSVDTAQKSSPDTVKVVFLGDSSTYGSSVPTDQTFVEVVDRLSPAISAINLGVPGYSSYQGYRRLLQRGLQLDPDVIVVSFNYNDRRYVLAEDQVDSAERFEQQTDAARSEPRLLEHIYLYRALRSLLVRAGIVASGDASVGKMRLDETYARVNPSDYRANLVRIIEWARDREAKVILMVMSDNPVQTEHLRRGIRALEEGFADTAIESLKIAVRLNNVYSDLARIHLAKAYELQGRVDDKLRTLTVNPIISLPGGTPIYLDTEYNEIMRQVGSEFGVPVFEVGQLLQPSQYLDNVHPDADGHREIGNLLYERFLRSETSAQEVR